MTNKAHKIKSNGHTIKLDNDTWQDIKKFCIDNYSRHIIDITTDDENQSFADFDLAGAYIIKAHNSIKTIGLYAQENDESLKIDYTHGRWTKQPALYAQAHYTSANENNIKEFMARLINTAKPEYIDLYNYLLACVYFFFMLSNTFKWFDYQEEAVIVLAVVFVIVVFAAVYNEINWGWKRIIIWLDDKKKNEEIKRTRKLRRVIYASYAVTLIFMVINVIF